MVGKKIKSIAIFLPCLGGGGAERVMLILAQSFSDMGHQVYLVVSSAKGELRSEIPSNVTLIDLDSKRTITSFPGLVRFLIKHKPDILLSALSLNNCMAVWAKRVARVNTFIAISERSNLSKTIEQSNQKIRNIVLPILMRWSYPYADAVIAISRGVAEDLIRHVSALHNKVHVVYNPIITNEGYDLAAKKCEHPWFGHGQPPVILGVGRLTYAKNFDLLIEAFNIVVKKQRAHLVILGEGEDRNELMALTKKLGIDHLVSMPGFMSNPYPFMKGAAVYVLSSRREGLANVLVQSMMCHTPVVSTDCESGPAEILEDGRYGKLVPVGDVDAMAKAISETLINENVFDFSCWKEERFRLDKVVDRYREILFSDV